MSDDQNMPEGDQPDLKRLAFRTPWGFLALGFGAGLFPRAPGTAGTAVAIPFALALQALPSLLALLTVLVLFAAGIPLCRVTETALGKSDHGAIVWDEFVGFLFVAALLPQGWIWILAAFIVFRIFDITKPWPIRWFEKRLHGGFGIMFDDAVAALYSIGLLRLVEYLAF